MSATGPCGAAFRLADVPVGGGAPPVFLGEIGTLFGQSRELALRMVDALADASRQVGEVPVLLKGEILHRADVCLDDDTVQRYRGRGGEERTERYRDLIERKVVPLADYGTILDHAVARGLPWVVSVYDVEGAAFACDRGCAALKIASFNIVHVPLLEAVGAMGVPVIVDTGRATLAEIDVAVRTLRGAGCDRVAINHNPDGHPAPPCNHHLRSIATLRRAFSVPVGLACHHVGTEMLFAAVALGAALLEKPIALDPGVVDVEHAWALALDEIPAVLAGLRDVWMALGSSFRPEHPQGLIATSARMGLVARRDLAPGDAIDLDSVTFAFPARGISVAHWNLVFGRRLSAHRRAGDVIGWSDVGG